MNSANDLIAAGTVLLLCFAALMAVAVRNARRARRAAEARARKRIYLPPEAPLKTGEYFLDHDGHLQIMPPDTADVYDSPTLGESANTMTPSRAKGGK